MFLNVRNAAIISQFLFVIIFFISWPGHSLAEGIPDLIRGLKSKNPIEREVSASTVMALRPDSMEFIVPLTEALEDENENVRKFSAVALGYYQKDPTAVKGLIRALEDESPEVRWRSARSLGRMKAKEAFEALAILVKSDKDRAVRAAAARATKTIPASGPA